MNRRDFLLTLTTTSTLATSTLTTPIPRPQEPFAGPNTPRLAGRRVGHEDVAALWNASALAREQDSKYGGGDCRTGAVAQCLQVQAAPMLNSSYTDKVGRKLYAAAAELSRTVGWSAVDMGDHRNARRHLKDALYLSRLAGDVQGDCYVMSTMALQAFLAGHPTQAARMAAGAYERARHVAAPRVLAFAKVAEARGHARSGHAREAGAALNQAETLLGQVRADNDPPWLGYFTHARLSGDATEMYYHLNNPAAALRWSRDAEAMPQSRFTRAVGLRTCVVGATHVLAGDMEQGLAVGNNALDILSTVRSTRACDYVRTLVTAAALWKRHPAVDDLADRAHREFGMPRLV